MTDLAAMSPVSLRATSVEPSDLEQHRVELTGLLLPHAGLGLRGRGRRPGHPGAGLARARPVRGPLGAALLALPHRHQRVLRPCSTADSAGPARWTSGPPASADAPAAVDPARGAPGSSRCPTAACCRRMPTRPTLAVARDSDPAGVRRRPAAPAAAAAGRAHPARGAALAGHRGRRPARHHGGVGQQRAPAGPGHARDARRPAAAGEPRGLDDAAAGPARPLRRRVRALRHRRARRRCCTRTRRSRCRPTPCGCGAGRRS